MKKQETIDELHQRSVKFLNKLPPKELQSFFKYTNLYIFQNSLALNINFNSERGSQDTKICRNVIFKGSGSS